MQESEFKHIVIDDDDEVVIQAGDVQGRSIKAEDTPARAAQEHPELVEDTKTEQETTTSTTIDADLLAAKGLNETDISDEARQEYERHARAAAKRHESTAMITTEEDLHTKMPFANMQRITVGVILILIIAFALYWFTSHPLGS